MNQNRGGNAPHGAQRRAHWVTVTLFAIVIAQLAVNDAVLNPIAGDSPDFLAIADSLMTDGSYSKHKVNGVPVPDMIRTPGYPLFLIACKLLFGDAVLGARILQPVAIFFGILVLFRVARREFGTAVANLALFLTILMPNYLGFSNMIIGEPIAMSAMILAVAIAVRPELSQPGAVLCGAAIGLCSLCRPNMLFLLGPVCAWLLVGKRMWREAAIVFLACSCVVFPWVVRNYRVNGTITPVHPARRPAFFFRFVETYYGPEAFFDLAMYHKFTPEMERDGLKARQEAINLAIGVPADRYTAVYSQDVKYFDTLEKQNRAEEEVHRWELELLQKRGMFDLVTRRVFSNAPRGWFTKKYPVPLAWLVGPVLITVSLVILGLAVMAWKLVFSLPLALFVAGYVVLGYACGYVSAVVMGVPAILTLFLVLRRPGANPLAMMSMAIMSHYMLLPVVLHVEGRYFAPCRPFVAILAALSASVIFERLRAARLTAQTRQPA